MTEHDSKPLRVATIGDINIDYIVDLSALGVPITMTLSGCYFQPVQTSVGGNGTFFAQAAKEAGFATSSLLATLGGDPYVEGQVDLPGRLALSQLRQSGVTPLVSIDRTRETGKVIILYQPDDQRLMVADRGANAGFALENLPPTEPILDQVVLLYVSGYSLLYPPQREAVQYLMQRFKDRGALIFIDIVPHDIFRMTSWKAFCEWTRQCDAVAAEATTMKGFLGLEQGSGLTTTESHRLVDMLLEQFRFCLIRMNSRSDFVLAGEGRLIELYVPYLERLASLRFTDRVIAHLLHSYLTHDRSLFASSGWIEKVTAVLSKRKSDMEVP